MTRPPVDEFRPLIVRWGALWGVPELAELISVRLSTRLHRSLGRCHPSTGVITLQARLADGDRALLEEVLCHEAAHVAVHRLRGAAGRPHGDEWRELVRAAGFEPRVRRAGEVVAPARPKPRRSGRFQYEHRCPVCQTVRYANTRHPRWRCLECEEAGLNGTLEIERVAQPGAVEP
jgi:predicted SprT family Zn-dependent metalloprotease